MKLWFFDHFALLALRVAGALGAPFYRLERWAYFRWVAAGGHDFNRKRGGN